MSQNLITFQPSATDLTAIDAALKTLEDKLIGLIDLSTEQRSTLMKMGDKSEAFCRKTVEVLAVNPNILPATFSRPWSGNLINATMTDPMMARTPILSIAPTTSPILDRVCVAMDLR